MSPFLAGTFSQYSAAPTGWRPCCILFSSWLSAGLWKTNLKIVCLYLQTKLQNTVVITRKAKLLFPHFSGKQSGWWAVHDICPFLFSLLLQQQHRHHPGNSAQNKQQKVGGEWSSISLNMKVNQRPEVLAPTTSNTISIHCGVRVARHIFCFCQAHFQYCYSGCHTVHQPY